MLDDRANDEDSERHEGDESCEDLPTDARSWAHDLAATR